jgi:DNA mismatch repair protein MutL
MEDAEQAETNRRVRRLDEASVERIAAGEVITRPARVVAELVDNSLDAGATRVTVEVDGDGTDRIRVADDGHGMGRDDAELAVERHATSKIRDASDLRDATSLGFRGEALPSIADAGTLELLTSDGGEVGTRIEMCGSEVAVEDAGRARGTTVVVHDLFADRPARKESLGGQGTEFGRISDLLTGYALVRPDVRFRLDHDGRTVFSTPGSGAFRDAAVEIYDRHVAAQSTTVEYETTVAFDGTERPLEIDAFLVYPGTTRADRSHLRVAVNGRPVGDTGVQRAVERGYGSLLPHGRHPVAVVACDVPPEAVDANVHPAKAEVGLAAREAVEAAVEEAVNDALTTADLRRSGELAMDLESSLTPKERESALAGVEVIGQFRDLYLLCADGDDLLVIDQHAAHERVNYERLQRAVESEGVESVSLDPAETVSLSPREASVVAEEGTALEAMGFEVAPFGGTTVKLSAVPVPLGRVADVDAFRETVTALAEGLSVDDGRDAVLADLACHPSLKAGDDLSDDDAEKLVSRLGQCDQPFACPHGRPTVLSIDEETLIRGFERGTRLG